MEGRGRYGHGVTGDRAPDVSVVILTTGDRPAELRAAVDSALRQDASDRRDRGRRQRHVGGPRTAERRSGPDRVAPPRTSAFPAAATSEPRRPSHPLRRLSRRRRPTRPTADTLAASAERLRRRTHSSASWRCGSSTTTVETARRHVPRVGAGGADRSGPVDRLPRWRCRHPPRSVRAGRRLRQPTSDTRWRRPISPCASSTTAGRSATTSTPAVVHPRTDPTRHPGAARRTMRNRVWLAYRNLPAPLAVVYVANWLVISAIRQPAPACRAVRRESATAGAPGPGVNGPRSAGAPSFGSPVSADRRSCETGSVPTMTGAADGNDAAARRRRAGALIAAHERRVEALRNSAQYRVGELVIASARSPRRLVRLPVDLWRLRKELLATNLVAPLASATTAPGPPGRRGHDPRRVLAPGVRPGVGPTPARGTPTARASSTADRTCAAVRRVGVEATAARSATIATPRRTAAPRSQAGIPTVFWNTEDPAPLRRLRRRGRAVRLDLHDRRRLHRPLRQAWPATTRRRPAVRRPAAPAQPGRRADPAPGPGLLRRELRPQRRRATSRCCSVRSSTPDCSTSDRPGRRASRRTTSRPRLTLPPLRVLPRRRLGDDVADDVLARVFELLACRTPVVSTPSRAIDELLGDAVITVETPGRRTSRRRAAGRRSRAPRPCRPARLPRRDVAAHVRPPSRPGPRHTRHRAHRPRHPA